VPSQNGLFRDRPQRQRVTRLRTSYSKPSAETTGIPPRSQTGPLQCSSGSSTSPIDIGKIRPGAIAAAVAQRRDWRSQTGRPGSGRPFCDGTHAKIGFDGTETASRASYAEQANVFDRPELRLTDVESLCRIRAFLRSARKGVEPSSAHRRPRGSGFPVSLSQRPSRPAGQFSTCWMKVARSRNI
jgi:hypothetical protein